MSDTLAADPNLKVSVTFERSVGLPGYNNFVKARAWAEGDLSPTADGSEIIVAQKRLFEALKIEVLTQLGIDFEFNEDGIVVEKVAAQAAQTLTVSEAAAKLEGSFNETPAQVAAAEASSQSGAAAQSDAFDWGKVPADVVADFLANPSAYFDNRPKKATGEYKSSAPDIKRKSDDKAFWIKSKF